jgi:hypothetical protein
MNDRFMTVANAGLHVLKQQVRDPLLIGIRHRHERFLTRLA